MYDQKISNRDYLVKLYPIQTGKNNQILRARSEIVKDIDYDLIELANILLPLMYEYDGVGLAAPQIGKNIRMIAVTFRSKGMRPKKLLKDAIIINPSIIEESDERVKSLEACLSVPNFEGNVWRHKKITIEYLDIQGKKKTKKLSDFNAFIIQHEIDHLDGILFVDKLINKDESG